MGSGEEPRLDEESSDGRWESRAKPVSEDFKPTGELEQGQELYSEFMLTLIGAERVKKKEMDVRTEVQKTGTALVFARRKWEQWMAVADELRVNSVIDDAVIHSEVVNTRED